MLLIYDKVSLLIRELHLLTQRLITWDFKRKSY